MSEQIKKTAIVLVSILGVLLIILFFIHASNESVLAPGKIQNNAAVKKTQKPAELPKPTGKVDDAVSAATAGLASEDNLLKEEDSSAESAVNDSSEVSSFGQSYDENEL